MFKKSYWEWEGFNYLGMTNVNWKSEKIFSI